MTWSDTKEPPSDLPRFNLPTACLMISDENERFAMSSDEIPFQEFSKGQQRVPLQRSFRAV